MALGSVKTVALVLSAVVAAGGAGCTAMAPTCGRCCVSCELERRTQHALGPRLQPGAVSLPDAVVLDDGLSEYEAVALAMQNNAAFQATLTRIGAARGDVIQAGLLTNPELSAYVPVGPKAWEFTLTLPVEALLVRPRRISLANCEFRRNGEELVQHGLNLIRDVRVAYAEHALATERSRLADRAVEIRERIAELADKQCRAGAISELETISARVDVQRSRAEAASQKQYISITRERLRNLLGLALSDVPIEIDVAPPAPVARQHMHALLTQGPDDLVPEALVSRPDLQAADYAVAAARERAELARWAFLSLGVSADANAPGKDGGMDIGPGIALRIPIFDRNQGGIVRADAELEQAKLSYEDLRQKAASEIRIAHAQLQQAVDNLDLLRRDVLPSLEEAVRLAEKAFTQGGTSYLLFWQTTAQLLEAQGRELDLMRDQHVAVAELERCIGKHLLLESPSTPEMSEKADESQHVRRGSPDPAVPPTAGLQVMRRPAVGPVARSGDRPQPSSEKVDESPKKHEHENVETDSLAADNRGWHPRVPR